jgi:hypothetical protein
MNKHGISLVDSSDHLNACHERWMERRNRKTESPEYQDDWLAEQCLFCRYYIPLVGIFMEDYEVCSNANSPSDGLVRFEHDGCVEFSHGEWWDAKRRHKTMSDGSIAYFQARVMHHTDEEGNEEFARDADQLIINNDLALEGKEISKVDYARVQQYEHITCARHRATIWLLGEYPLYSELPVDT